MSEHVIAIEELKYELLLGSKVDSTKQQRIITERYVFKDIKDVWVEKEERRQHLEGECEKLKQRRDLMQTPEVKGVRCDGFENDNSKSVVEKWRRYFNVLNLFWKIYISTTWSKDVYVLVCEGEVHLQSDENKICFQQETKLDIEIDHLCNLIEFFKKIYDIMKKIVRCKV